MKSKVLLIMPPDGSDLDTLNYPFWSVCRVPSLGLIAVGSYLEAKGHDVKIIDCRELIVRYRTRDYIQLVLKIVNQFKPDIIGINMLTALFDESKNISRALKKDFPNCKIIAGGCHPSVEPVLTLQQIPYIDAICIGPGEEVLLDIANGLSINEIKGLMRRDCIDKFEKRAVNLDIDKYPFPNYDLVGSTFYTDFTINTITGWGYKGLAAVTSRSCPYSCKFCASDWSKPFCYHSSQYVIEMIKHLLKKYDIDVIAFFDDTMTISRRRLCEICEGFIHERLFYPYTNVRWNCQMRANQASPDLLKLMKKSGCFRVSFGMESGSDRMLKVLNKKVTVEMNKRACAYVKEAGLELGGSFMIGIPGETETEMNETLTFMQNLNCRELGLGIFRPLPGSPFYYEFVNRGILSREHIDWCNLGNFTCMSDQIFCDVSRKEFEEIYKKGLEIAYGNKWVTVHEDTLLRHHKEIKGIASQTRIRVCKPDNYESSTHIPYNPLTIYTLKKFVPRPIRHTIKNLLAKYAESRIGWLSKIIRRRAF